ncbi:E3 SUMO-protein ligase PIAS1-like [Lampetra fluviatilis]
MAECAELKQMVMSFRVSELQVLLGFAGQNKSGRKHELVTRALQLLQADCGPAVRMKVQELYRRRYPRKPTAAVAQAVADYPYHAALALSQLYEAASAPAPAPHELLAPPAPRKHPAPPPSSSSTAPAAATVQPSGLAKAASQQQQAGGGRGGRARAPAASQTPDGTAPAPAPSQPVAAGDPRAAAATAPVQLAHLPFYDVLHELVPPTALVGNNGQRYQETYFTFALSSQDISMLSGSRDYFPGDESDFPVQLQLRFCLADSGSAQDDNFPPNLCVKVNGKPCMLPGYLPPSKNGAEPKRPSRPINVTPYVRLSTSTHNHVSVVWTSDYGKSFAVSLALVRHLTSAALLQRLRSKGTQEAAVSRALIMEKLRLDPDSDIATTSLRVSLLCPVRANMRMSVPCRARSCSHLQCFDAALFIAMNEKKPTWVCPVCDKAAPYPSLLIDGLFVGILSECDEVEEVEFGPDGSWVPAPHGREERAHTRTDRAGQADKPRSPGETTLPRKRAQVPVRRSST